MAPAFTPIALNPLQILPHGGCLRRATHATVGDEGHGSDAACSILVSRTAGIAAGGFRGRNRRATVVVVGGDVVVARAAGSAQDAEGRGAGAGWRAELGGLRRRDGRRRREADEGNGLFVQVCLGRARGDHRRGPKGAVDDEADGGRQSAISPGLGYFAEFLHQAAEIDFHVSAVRSEFVRSRSVLHTQ